MGSDKHTPTPWRAVDDMVLATSDGRTDHVADCMTRRDSVREANASYIVTCVNAHEELVGALIACHRYFKNRTGNEEIQLCEIAGAALAKVSP